MKTLSVTQNAIFNSAGAIIYSLCQWAVTMVIVRMSGDYESTGILQLAISVTVIFYTIACYVPRTYQISDVSGEYSAGEYVGIRITFSVLAAMLCLLYAVISGYRGIKLACIMAYMAFRITEAVSDVFRAFCKVNRRMDFEFFSYCFRGVTSLAAFVFVMRFSGNVFFATASMAFPAALTVLLFDRRAARCFVDVTPVFDLTKIRKAAFVCLPLVISSFAGNAYSAIPRQFLDGMLGSDALGYYATVATPIVIVQLLATSIFNPMLTRFTELYTSRNIPEIKRFFLKTAAGLAGLALLALAGAKIAGEFVYVLLYGDSIRNYCYLMYAVILCSVLYAACWFTGNILIIMRKQRIRLLCTIAGLVPIFFFSRPMIRGFGMNGVSFSVLIGYCLSSALYTIFIVQGFRRN